MQKSFRLAVVCLVAVSVGCEFGSRSGRGLRIGDGDAERGARTFVELGCVRCHVIAGESAPEGAVVPLGGEVLIIPTHGQLFTAIINPAHEVSRSAANGEPLVMENFNDRMTVEQLVDLTAFLQSRHWIRPEPAYAP